MGKNDKPERKHVKLDTKGGVKPVEKLTKKQLQQMEKEDDPKWVKDGKDD